MKNTPKNSPYVTSLEKKHAHLNLKTSDILILDKMNHTFKSKIVRNCYIQIT